jgi:hypothetical protein
VDEETHEVLANATVALIAFHVLGVLVASFQHRWGAFASLVSDDPAAPCGGLRRETAGKALTAAC